MNFEKIPPIQHVNFYLDLAFRKATEKAAERRAVVEKDNFQKSKTIELIKVRTIKEVLTNHVEKIPKTFPSVDGVSEFYRELFATFLDIPFLKKSLGSINWAIRRIKELSQAYEKKFKYCREPKRINSISREFYGRIASVLHKIEKQLIYLEQTRRIAKDFPDVKEEFTVCIVGFPNVGKTTLLNKLAGTKAEVKVYAFTTKRLNVGYVREGRHVVQIIDTPGTLHRFEKMNAIEKQAYLAMKYCAHALIYVFDLTEPYPLQDQEKLLHGLRDFHKPIIQYISKTDILSEEEIASFRGNKKLFSAVEAVKQEMIRIKEEKEKN